MSQAIVTKFHSGGADGPRIKATASAGSVYVAASQGHAAAAIKLAKKYKWTGTLTEGGLPDGSRVFVFGDGEKHRV
jgi:hypothetical protein